VSEIARVSLTFGSAADLEHVAAQLGQVLRVTFELRDSMYLGGEYHRAEQLWGEVIARQNDDLGEPAEPTHPELPTLVQIDAVATAEPSIVEAIQPLSLVPIDRTAWSRPSDP
jgi:hypothetical protein